MQMEIEVPEQDKLRVLPEATEQDTEILPPLVAFRRRIGGGMNRNKQNPHAGACKAHSKYAWVPMDRNKITKLEKNIGLVVPYEGFGSREPKFNPIRALSIACTTKPYVCL